MTSLNPTDRAVLTSVSTAREMAFAEPGGHRAQAGPLRSHLRSMGDWWSRGDLNRYAGLDPLLAPATVNRSGRKLAAAGLVARKLQYGAAYYQLTDAGREHLAAL